MVLYSVSYPVQRPMHMHFRGTSPIGELVKREFTERLLVNSDLPFDAFSQKCIEWLGPGVTVEQVRPTDAGTCQTRRGKGYRPHSNAASLAGSGGCGPCRPGPG